MNRKYFLFPAILELEIPMGFRDTIKPICLSHWTKKQYNRNDRGVIAGWGQHRQGQSWASKLKEVQAVIFTNPFCREILKYHYNYHWHKLTRYEIVKLRQGSGKEGQGMALKAKALKLKPLPRAWVLFRSFPNQTASST